jgi:predicted RNA-binding protein YlxR (DUF448 family)
MPKQRRVPQRTCVGCGEVQGKRDLVRIVRAPDGTVAVDPTGKRNGRGAYVHRELSCFERAAAGRLLRALRVPEAVDQLPRLREEFEALLRAPAPRKPQVHRAPVPLPEHLIARNRRGPTRTPPRRSRAGQGGQAAGGDGSEPGG